MRFGGGAPTNTVGAPASDENARDVSSRSFAARARAGSGRIAATGAICPIRPGGGGRGTRRSDAEAEAGTPVRGDASQLGVASEGGMNSHRTFEAEASEASPAAAGSAFSSFGGRDRTAPRRGRERGGIVRAHVPALPLVVLRQPEVKGLLVHVRDLNERHGARETPRPPAQEGARERESPSDDCRETVRKRRAGGEKVSARRAPMLARGALRSSETGRIRETLDH